MARSLNITRFRNSLNSICNVKFWFSTAFHEKKTIITTEDYEAVNRVTSPTQKDLSDVTPYFPETFNVAAYVNKSSTLKNLIDMNVEISKLEKKPHIFQSILKLDFEKDMKAHIFFLSDYVGSESVPKLISKNPMIFKESLDDLSVRVNYLMSKCFTNQQIKEIITKNPFWLMFSTERIDRRLGFFQNFFLLEGEELRTVSTKQPKLITYNLHHVKTNSFVIKEEMGFQDDEVKALLLTKPKLWLMNQRTLLERFNYLHNVIKIPHHMLLTYPQVLECRNFLVKQRNMFLEKLGRAQYDPKKENYVPVMALAAGSDVEFCRQYAKCTVSDFNMFLKTL